MSEGWPRIAFMFDSLVAVPLEQLSGPQLAVAITDNQADLMRASCRMLELACAWADLHSREPEEYSPVVERAKFYSGAGTPAVSEFCVAEFGALHGTGAMTAQMLIADALDLRHRLPRL
jgi:hypothetical protein